MLTVINIKGEELERKVDTEVCDTSRRKLLKKAYATPVVVALGSMVFSADAKAWGPFGGGHKHFSGCGHNSGGGSSSSSSSSSVSGGHNWCSMCKKYWPCSHHP